MPKNKASRRGFGRIEAPSQGEPTKGKSCKIDKKRAGKRKGDRMESEIVVIGTRMTCKDD